MIKKHKRNNIITNEVFGWNFQGKVVKINIKAKVVPEQAFIEVLTEEREILASQIISQRNTNIYPINKIEEEFEPIEEEMIEVLTLNGQVIEISETVQGEPIINQTGQDYYYVSGNLAFRITGLQEGESINSVSVFYEFSENQS